MYENLAVVAAFAFAYSVVAGRLERTPVSGPVVFLAFGVLAGPLGLGLLRIPITGEGLRTIAELTLALVLFTDASNADLSVLRRTFHLPQRLLLVGLPLTILLGVAVGRILLPELSWLEIAVLATLLAPTDAALGQAVVANPAVPATVREGLNVESGLNDGICVPMVLALLTLASETGARVDPGALALRLVAEAIGVGAAVGVGLTVAAAWALRAAGRRGFLAGSWLGIPIVALALACFALAQLAGGSGFIACFTGGLVFGALPHEHKHAVLAGAEGAGKVFALVTWLTFGAAVVWQHRGTPDWRMLLYAALSLTVVRMLPVFVSVLGFGLDTRAKLFLGWFGPRGLASIVFGVLALDARLPHGDILVATTVATVVGSIVAHGLSAEPLAAAFAAHERAEPGGG